MTANQYNNIYSDKKARYLEAVFNEHTNTFFMHVDSQLWYIEASRETSHIFKLMAFSVIPKVDPYVLI